MPRPIGLTLLLATAFGARLAYDTWFVVHAEPAVPAIPLSEYPRGVLGDGWHEEDVPLDDRIVQIAGVFDYLNRKFTNGRRELTFYVGFVSGAHTLARHHPEICFPRQGLSLDNRSAIELEVAPLEGRQSFYATRWSSQLAGRAFCLHSFYYSNHFAPEDWKLPLADRFGGLSHHALVMVVGDELPEDRSRGRLRGEALPQDSATIDFYRGALTRLIPPLLRHFPEAAAEER